MILRLAVVVAGVICGGRLGAAQSAGAPSGLVSPATGMLQQTLGRVHPERWKASRAVKDATAANVGSISRDLTNTLPGLLATADAAPDSVAGVLPVSRNLAALYEVLLRVTVTAETAAPKAEVSALEQARMSLDAARRTVDDRVQSVAVAEGQQVTDLRKALSAAKAAAAAAPSTVPAPVTPATKAKPKRKPVPQT